MRNRPPKPAPETPEDQRSPDAPEHAKNDIERTYREQSGSLRRSLGRLLPSFERWDALHDLFAKFLDRGLGNTAEPYLRKSVTNQALDNIKKRQCRDRHEQALMDDQLLLSGRSAEEIYEIQQIAAIAERAIRALPEQERKALTFVRMDGLTDAEAAARMGCKANKVRRLVSKALCLIRADIKAARGDA